MGRFYFLLLEYLGSNKHIQLIEMRNPLEVAADLYDYQYQYLRWFLHRRVTFNDVSAADVKDSLGVNIFANNDAENVAQLVTTSTAAGAALGAGLGAWKYALLTEMKAKTFRKGFPAAAGIFAVATAAGFTYGALVNTTAKLRGEKNDLYNHVTATMAVVPVTGVFAKTNRLQWGLLNAVMASVLVGYMKYASSGEFIGAIPRNAVTSVCQRDTGNSSDAEHLESIMINVFHVSGGCN